MDQSIVSTSKAWYYMYTFRRNKTTRHDVSPVQSVVEGTFFSFSYLVPKISILLNATSQARQGTDFIHNVYDVYN